MTYEKLVEIMRKYDVDHSGQIEFGELPVPILLYLKNREAVTWRASSR